MKFIYLLPTGDGIKLRGASKIGTMDKIMKRRDSDVIKIYPTDNYHADKRNIFFDETCVDQQSKIDSVDRYFFQKYKSLKEVLIFNDLYHQNQVDAIMSLN